MNSHHPDSWRVEGRSLGIMTPTTSRSTGSKQNQPEASRREQERTDQNRREQPSTEEGRRRPKSTDARRRDQKRSEENRTDENRTTQTSTKENNKEQKGIVNTHTAHRNRNLIHGPSRLINNTKSFENFRNFVYTRCTKLKKTKITY